MLTQTCTTKGFCVACGTCVVFVLAAKEASEAAIGASAAANRPSELANAVPRTNDLESVVKNRH